MTTVEDIRRAILTHDEISGELPWGATVRTRISVHDGVPMYLVSVNYEPMLVYHSAVGRWYGRPSWLTDWLGVEVTWLFRSDLCDLYIRPLDSLPEIRRLVEVSP